MKKSRQTREQIIANKRKQRKLKPNMKEVMKNILLNLEVLSEASYKTYRKQNNPSQLPLWRNMNKYVDLEEISRLRETATLSE